MRKLTGAVFQSLDEEVAAETLEEVDPKLQKELLEKLSLPVIPASEAARAILRGVERNRGVIVFPRSARFLWRLTRFSPWLLSPFQQRMIRQLRSVRRNSSAT